MKLRNNKMLQKFTALFLTLLMVLSVLPMANIATFVAEAINVENPMNYYGGDDVRVDMNFNKNWRFHLGDMNASEAADISVGDELWSEVELPHDFSIEQEFSTSGTEVESGMLPGGTGWYRKQFTLPTALEGKRLILTFDGSYKDTTVYVNGTEIGQNHYGYNSFSFDITNFVYYANGDHYDSTTGSMTTSTSNNCNLIAVKVSNVIPSSRWYSGSGINRDVTLSVVEPVHVSLYGTQVTTASNKTDGTATTSVTLQNDSAVNANVTVKAQVLNLDGTENGAQVSKNVTVNHGASQTVSLAPVASSFKMWDIYDGNLYIVRTELYVDGVLVDKYDTKFGYRYFDWSTANGFSINGKNVKVQGVCIHQDSGALGVIQTYDAIYRQVSILKDMGCNAIRTSHNISSSVYLDVCAELGMLVLDEFYDGWFTEKNGNTHDFHEYFSAQVSATNPTINLIGATSSMSWAEYTCKEAVKRDRNYPSVFMWDIGNELQGNEYGNNNNWGTNLCTWIRANDAANRKITWGNNTGSPKAIDTNSNGCNVLGGNYHSGEWADDHNSGYIFIASESVSAVSSRGYYKASYNSQGAMGYNTYYTSEADKQINGYDASYVSWGDNASHGLYQTLANDWWSGQFVWTGFDYIGEPTPWESVGSSSNINTPNSSYFGIIDTAGFAKDTYYLYRSIWNKTSNTLHIVPGSWDTSNMLQIDGFVPVAVYSNAKHVKLFLNGEEIANATATVNKQGQAGEYKTWTETIKNASKCNATELQVQSDKGNDHDLYPQFRVKYEAGTLEVKAYSDTTGTQEITETVGVNKVESGLDYSAPYVQAKVWGDTKYAADGDSYAYIEYTALSEENGKFLPNCNDTITVSLSGSTVDCEIVGVDNGNAATIEKFQQPSVLSADKQQASIKLFNGKAVVIVKVLNSDKSGVVRLSQLRGTTNAITIEGATFKVAADTVKNEFEEICPQDVVSKEITVEAKKEKTQEVFDAVEAPEEEEETEDTASYLYEKYTPRTTGQIIEDGIYAIYCPNRSAVITSTKFNTANNYYKWTSSGVSVNDNILTVTGSDKFEYEFKHIADNKYTIRVVGGDNDGKYINSTGNDNISFSDTPSEFIVETNVNNGTTYLIIRLASTTNVRVNLYNGNKVGTWNTGPDQNERFFFFKKVKENVYTYNKYTPTGTGTGAYDKTINVDIVENIRYAYPGISTDHNDSADYYVNFTEDSSLKENLSSYLWNFEILNTYSNYKSCRISAPSINSDDHALVYMDLSYSASDAGCPVFANVQEHDKNGKDQISVYYDSGKGFNFNVDHNGVKRLEFNHDSTEYTFNLNNSASCPDTCYFKLFRQATGSETGSVIPGYVEINSLSDITANGKYLIVAVSNSNYYLLRPADAYMGYGQADNLRRHHNFVARLGQPESTVTGTRPVTSTAYRQYIADGTYIIYCASPDTNPDGGRTDRYGPAFITNSAYSSGTLLKGDNTAALVNDGNTLTGATLSTGEYEFKFNETNGQYSIKAVSTGKYININGNDNIQLTDNEQWLTVNAQANGTLLISNNGTYINYYSDHHSSNVSATSPKIGAWGGNNRNGNDYYTLFAKEALGEDEEIVSTGKEIYSFYKAENSTTQIIQGGEKTFHYVDDGYYGIYWFWDTLNFHGKLEALAGSPGSTESLTETGWLITKETDDPEDSLYTITTTFPAGGNLYYLGFDASGLIVSRNRHVVRIETRDNSEAYDFYIGNKAGSLWLKANGDKLTYVADKSQATSVYLSQATVTDTIYTVNGTDMTKPGTAAAMNTNVLANGKKFYFHNSYTGRYLTADGNSVKATSGIDNEKSVWTLEQKDGGWALRSYDGKYISYTAYSNDTWKNIVLADEPTIFSASVQSRSYFGSYEGFVFESTVGSKSYEIHDEDKEAWGYYSGSWAGTTTDSLWGLLDVIDYIEGGDMVNHFDFSEDAYLAHSKTKTVSAHSVTIPGVDEQYYVVYNILPNYVAPNVIYPVSKEIVPYGETAEMRGVDLDTDTFFSGEDLLVTKNSNELKFVNVSGDEYYVKSHAGKYLSITSSALAFVDTPTTVNVKALDDGKVVIYDNGYAVAHVRNSSTTTKGGYVSLPIADVTNPQPEFILSLYCDNDNLFYIDDDANEHLNVKRKLYDTIAHALTYNTEDYTDESYAQLIIALNSAIETYKDDYATIENYYLAIELIENALNELIPEGARFPGTIYKYGYSSADSTVAASEGQYAKAGGYNFNLQTILNAKRKILGDEKLVAQLETLLANAGATFEDTDAGNALREQAVATLAEQYARIYSIIFTGNGYKGSNIDAQSFYNPSNNYRVSWNWWTKDGTQNPGTYDIGVTENKDEGVSLYGLFTTDLSNSATGLPSSHEARENVAIPYINIEENGKGGVTSNLSCTVSSSAGNKTITLTPLAGLNVFVPELFEREAVQSTAINTSTLSTVNGKDLIKSEYAKQYWDFYFPFKSVLNNATGITTYVYDGADNSYVFRAAYNDENHTANAKLQDVSGWSIKDGLGDTAKGFFPFNYKLDDTSVTSFTGQNAIFHYGVTFSTDFTLPTSADHKYHSRDNSTTAASEDVTFSFRGDDDVLVYVDDILILDNGGLHGARSIDINFTEETVSYEFAMDSEKNVLINRPDVPGITYKWGDTANNAAKGITPDVQKALDKLHEIWDEHKTHTLKFYYLERGSTASNCKIQFNLKTVNEVIKTDDQKLVADYGLPVEYDLNSNTDPALKENFDAHRGNVNEEEHIKTEVMTYEPKNIIEIYESDDHKVENVLVIDSVLRGAEGTTKDYSVEDSIDNCTFRMQSDNTFVSNLGGLYLDSRNNGYPTKTASTADSKVNTITPVNGKFTLSCSTNSNRAIAFMSDYRFDAGSNAAGSTNSIYQFDIYRKANADEDTSASAIPGFIKITDVNELTQGVDYIFVHQGSGSDTKLYAIRPTELQGDRKFEYSAQINTSVHTVETGVSAKYLNDEFITLALASGGYLSASATGLEVSQTAAPWQVTKVNKADPSDNVYTLSTTVDGVTKYLTLGTATAYIGNSASNVTIDVTNSGTLVIGRADGYYLHNDLSTSTDDVTAATLTPAMAITGTYTDTIIVENEPAVVLDSVKRGVSASSASFTTDDTLANCAFQLQSNGSMLSVDRSEHSPGLIIDAEWGGRPTRGSNTNVVNNITKAQGTTDKFLLINNTTRAIAFLPDVYRFDAGNVGINTTDTRYHFYIYRQANAGEDTSTSAVPGYVKVTETPLSQNVNYIFVHEGNDGKLYALRPTANTGDNDRYKYVAQINTHESFDEQYIRETSRTDNLVEGEYYVLAGYNASGSMIDYVYDNGSTVVTNNQQSNFPTDVTSMTQYVWEWTTDHKLRNVSTGKYMVLGRPCSITDNASNATVLTANAASDTRVEFTYTPSSSNSSYPCLHHNGSGNTTNTEVTTWSAGDASKFYVYHVEHRVHGEEREISHTYLLDGTYAVSLTAGKYATAYDGGVGVSRTMTGWNFEKINSEPTDTKYRVSTVINGQTKYLSITVSGLQMVSSPAEVDVIVTDSGTIVIGSGRHYVYSDGAFLVSGTNATALNITPVIETGETTDVIIGDANNADIEYLGVIMAGNEKNLPTAENSEFYDSAYTDYPFDKDHESYVINGQYGDLEVFSDGRTKYTINTMVFDGTDTFYIVTQVINDPNYVYGDYLVIEKLTYIPATSVYYEDDFDTVTYVDAGVSDDTFGKWSVVRDDSVEAATAQAADLVGSDTANAYGFDPAYETFATYSNASAHKVTVSAKNKNPWPYAQFTFAGTGFDIISLTDNLSGVFAVSVYKGTNTSGKKVTSKTVDNYYGYSYGQLYVNEMGKTTHDSTDAKCPLYKTTYTSKEQIPEDEKLNTIYFLDGKIFSNIPSYYDANGNVTRTETSEPAYAYGWLANTSASDKLYQIPVLKITDLTYGTYTVKVEARYSAMFGHDYTLNGTKCFDLLLDAIRIYNPAGPGTTTSAAGNAVAAEAYVKDHEAYIDSKEIKDLVIGSETLTTNGNEGIIFIDGHNAINTDLLSDYKSIGPNNELYLNDNQAIVFEIWATQVPTDIQIGAKLAGNTNSGKAGATLQIVYDKASFDKAVNSATEMYYSFDDILGDATGNKINAEKLTWTPVNAKNGVTYYRSGAIIIRNAAESNDSVLSITNIKWTFENYGATGYYKIPDNISDVVSTASAPKAPALTAMVNATDAARAEAYMKSANADLTIDEESVQVSENAKAGQVITVNFTTSVDVASVNVAAADGKKFIVDSIKSEIVEKDGEQVKNWTVTLRANEPGTYVYEFTGVSEYEFAQSDKALEVTVDITKIALGDMNGDGAINTADRMILARYLAQWDGAQQSIADTSALDINGDGVVNTADRMILSRAIAQWDGYSQYLG